MVLWHILEGVSAIPLSRCETVDFAPPSHLGFAVSLTLFLKLLPENTTSLEFVPSLECLWQSPDFF